MPCNYQYPHTAAIYKILSQFSPDYSAFLHDRGYTGLDGKPRKLFTFFFRPIPRAGWDGREESNPALRDGIEIL